MAGISIANAIGDFQKTSAFVLKTNLVLAMVLCPFSTLAVGLKMWRVVSWNAESVCRAMESMSVLLDDHQKMIHGLINAVSPSKRLEGDDVGAPPAAAPSP